jgi:DNA gyrase subunit B
MQVSVWRDKQHFWQKFAYGKPQLDMTAKPAEATRNGTRIKFKYDTTIFSKDAAFDIDVISRRLRELAFLNSNATLKFEALKSGEIVRDETFQFDGGIAAYVEHITGAQHGGAVLHDCIHFQRSFENFEVCKRSLSAAQLHPIVRLSCYEADTGKGCYLSGLQNLGLLQVDVALQWSNTHSETLVSFVNCIRTMDGGTHVEGLKQAIVRTVNKLAREKGLLKDASPNLSGEHVREGLTAVRCPRL